MKNADKYQEKQQALRYSQWVPPVRQYQSNHL